MKPDKSEVSILDQIMREIRPAPGREREAFSLFDRIEKMVVTPTADVPITQTVCSLLLRPSIRSLLGMSHGTKATDIPSWLIFPILRLATVARLGNVCRSLDLGSIKFGVGNDKLAAPVFAATMGTESAESIASYVVAGNFRTDLGALTSANPTILNAVLKFRDTAFGATLRQSILHQLSGSNGAEVAASINAGINSAIGTEQLQSARGAFSQLCVAPSNLVFPAGWFDRTYSDKALVLWRQRSITEFKQLCDRLKLKAYDLCPCGSGEKARFCCLEALRSEAK